MITLDLSEVFKYILATAIPLILALVGAKANPNKVSGLIIWFGIFLAYWALATIGILHIMSRWF